MGNKLFQDIGKEANESAPRERKRKTRYLESRDRTLADLTSGDLEQKQLRWVDPTICRMWEHHNRRYDLLNEDRCRDLIDGFIAQGGQEFPAIVRKLDGDPDYQYEVICGARRHWTVNWLRAHNYPDFKFLIEVRELTDEAAFRLSDVENRDKKDISDYERACDYAKALELYYPTQKDMARRLEVSAAWLSRYLSLASLPQWLCEAFGDVTALKVEHARTLTPLLKDRAIRRKVEKAAKDLVQEQQRLQAAGANHLPPQAVVKKLIDASKGRAVKKPAGLLAQYTTKSGKPCLSANRQGASGLVLKVIPGSGATKQELLDACGKAIEEFA